MSSSPLPSDLSPRELSESRSHPALATLRTWSESPGLAGLHVDVGAAAALVALGGHDLVVVGAQVEADAAPCVELFRLLEGLDRKGKETYVVLHGDAATDALLGADGPVLLEGAGTVDGRLVGASGNIEVVGTAVGGDAALVLGPAAGVVGAVRLNDVVLDEGVASPAIDGKVAVAAGVE